MKKSLSELISDYPLFKEFIADDKYLISQESFIDPYSFHEESFNHFCEYENHSTTFELELPEHSLHYWASQPGNKIPEEVYGENGRIDFIHHFVGICQSCKRFEINLLLHIWSDKEIPKEKGNVLRFDETINKFRSVDEIEKDNPKIYIEKIGVYPERQVKLDIDVKKYFDRESENLYYKAIKSHKEALGIASFAYFRRIIEKELVRILNDIAELNGADHKLKDFIEEYKHSQKAHLIYENVFDLLPKSLQSLGVNPMKFLYKQTSEGLHSTSDKDCLKKAGQIDLILKFVIKKINEENSELSKIRDAIKDIDR